MPKHQPTPQELAFMLDRMRPSSSREDEWSTMDTPALQRYEIPTPSQEALQPPTVDPIDLLQGGASVGGMVASRGKASLQSALDGIQTLNRNRALPGYIPPGYRLEQQFIPKDGIDLLTASQLRNRGIDPYSKSGQAAFDRTWAETGKGTFDYAPRGVQTRSQASRWLQHNIGKRHGLNQNQKDDLVVGELGFGEK